MSSQPGATASPGTATTSSPETTIGHASRALPRHLCVDEHVLNLLRATGETVARPARADGEAGARALDPPRPERHAPFEADLVVLAYGTDAVAEIGGLRPGVDARRSIERALELARQPWALVRQGEEVLLRARMQPAQQRKHLVADEPALRGCVRRVRRGSRGRARRSSGRVLPPDVEERPYDAVLPLDA